MPTSFTNNLQLKITDNLSADAVYNLHRIDTLAGNITISLTSDAVLRSKEHIIIEPDSPDTVGGTGTGIGDLTLGRPSNYINWLRIYAKHIDLGSGIIEANNLTLPEGHVLIGSSSGVSEAVDTTALGQVLGGTSSGLTLKSGIITDSNVAPGAGIAWSKISKGGSSVGDLADRSHTLLTSIGTYSHPQIDSHIDDLTIHFPESSVFLKTEFIDESTGVADAGKPVILDTSGKLSASLFVVEFAEKVAIEFDCPVSASVGQLVTINPSIPGEVLPLSTNVFTGIAFGVIIDKITSTRCKILVSGKLQVSDTLAPGSPVFVSTSGGFTTTPVVSGHRQIMGIAIATNQIFLLPSPEKVKL